MTDQAATLPRPNPAPGQVTHPAPVFLLAPARSYSTVSLALLAGHPALYGFPELLLFVHPTIAGLLAEKETRLGRPAGWNAARLRGVCRAVAQVHDGDQGQAAVDRAEAWLRQHADWRTTDLFDHLLDQVVPGIGLEKSPDTSSTDESLAACLAAYPQARYIHLTRHPATTIRSMREHWSKRYEGRPESVLNATSATSWHQSHQRIIKALAGLPRDRWLRVRAEDLLREPQTELPKILDWLAIDSAPPTIDRMLRTEQWRFARPDAQARYLGGGDPKFLAAPALRPVAAPGPLTFDPALGFPAEMERRMRDLATQLGY